MLSVLAFTAALGFSGAAGATLINRGADLRRRPQHPLAREWNLAGTETFDLTRSSNENPTLDVNVITRWRKMHRW